MRRFEQPNDDRVRRAKDRFREQLLARPGVVTVGIGKHPTTGEAAVSIGVDRPLDLGDVLPAEFPDDVPAFVRETDPPGPFQHTGRHRPVPLGVSTGTENIAGTIAYILDDGATFYLSSNNHVYAGNELHTEPIIQPGPADGGSAPDDTIGFLTDFVTLEDGTTADVAWAEPEVEIDNFVHNVAVPAGSPIDPAIDDTITKSGRTTGVTSAPVTEVHVDAQVDYGFATFIVEDNFVTEPRADGGDSGSPGLGQDDRPAGVLFAGNSNGDFYNYASNWEAETGMTVVTGALSWDPSAVVVDACGLGASSVATDETIELTASVSNGNDIGVTFDIVWAADGTEFARLSGVSLAAGSSETFVMTYDMSGFGLGGGTYDITSSVPTTTVARA